MAKNVLIIGASSVIVSDFIKYLNLNNYNVDVILRNKHTKIDNVNILGYYDLENKEDIYNLIDVLKNKHYDLFYFNAGCIKDYNTSYMVNFYSFYLISKHTISSFDKIIITSSISYKNVNIMDNKSDYLFNYRKTKKMLMLYTYYGLSVYNICFIHPGLVYTKLFSKLHPRLKFTKYLLNSKSKASLCFIKAINHNKKDYMIGPWFFDFRGKPVFKRINFKKLNISEYNYLIEGLNKGDIC